MVVDRTECAVDERLSAGRWTHREAQRVLINARALWRAVLRRHGGWMCGSAGVEVEARRGPAAESVVCRLALSGLRY